MRSTSTNSNASDGTKRAKTASSAASHINIAQKMTLSVEQQKVLALVVAEGKNIFFTGSAGKFSFGAVGVYVAHHQERENLSSCERSSKHCGRNMRRHLTLSQLPLLPVSPLATLAV